MSEEESYILSFLRFNNMKNCFSKAVMLWQPIVFLLLFGFSITIQAQNQTKELTNLVIFVRFADDAEIDHPFASIDSMFNGRTPGVLSVYNFYDVVSYGKIHYNTVYTNNIQNGQIVSYQDSYPRGYFEPYSPDNPIGYTEPNPFIGVSMREAELLGRIVRYVDSMGLVDPDIVLLGLYYILVILGYLVFEMIPINYRPILINGALEASYPSSTTLLVLSVMPTLVFQVGRRWKRKTVKRAVNLFVVLFSAFMVLGRAVSGVHWATDIVGSVLLSFGLFKLYQSGVTAIDLRNKNGVQ